jgi:hypothetical protein
MQMYLKSHILNTINGKNALIFCIKRSPEYTPNNIKNIIRELNAEKNHKFTIWHMNAVGDVVISFNRCV